MVPWAPNGAEIPPLPLVLSCPVLYTERLSSITGIPTCTYWLCCQAVGMGRGKKQSQLPDNWWRQQLRQTWRSCDFRGEKRLQRALGRGMRPTYFFLRTTDHGCCPLCTPSRTGHIRLNPVCQLESSRRRGWGGTHQEAQKV